MDGVQIPASAFDTISGSDFSYASFQVADGTHKIESDSGFIAYYYALDQVDSYGLSLTGYDNPVITHLNERPNKEENFKLFPNPAYDLLTIQLPSTALNSDYFTIQVIDVNSKCLINKQINSSQIFSIDVSNLSSGIYFISIKDINNAFIGKSKFCIYQH
ncbi:MAG: T9SS type A sorting domain-containing protein [Bacteroidetes bacterium]|nr:T9SS type A sorting domain-containing protein [Bacteroidota bacterium]